ncbi:hypothetical protein ACO0KY_14910 [Undibacterium sp. Dicai25W]|uniref:hypothetical protein n=1 Tax=Undibacterium sp. Dicai25W TaxID=3413034 RepID=UPI003BF265FA
MKTKSKYKWKLSQTSRVAVLIGLACLSMRPVTAQIVTTGSTSVRNQNGVDIVNMPVKRFRVSLRSLAWFAP